MFLCQERSLQRVPLQQVFFIALHRCFCIQSDATLTMGIWNKEMKADKEVEVLTSVFQKSSDVDVYQCLCALALLNPFPSLSLLQSLSLSLLCTHSKSLDHSCHSPLELLHTIPKNSFETKNIKKKLMHER